MVQWMDQNGPVDELKWFSGWIRMIHGIDQNGPVDGLEWSSGWIRMVQWMN